MLSKEGRFSMAQRSIASILTRWRGGQTHHSNCLVARARVIIRIAIGRLRTRDAGPKGGMMGNIHSSAIQQAEVLV